GLLAGYLYGGGGRLGCRGPAGGVSLPRQPGGRAVGGRRGGRKFSEGPGAPIPAPPPCPSPPPPPPPLPPARPPPPRPARPCSRPAWGRTRLGSSPRSPRDRHALHTGAGRLVGGRSGQSRPVGARDRQRLRGVGCLLDWPRADRRGQAVAGHRGRPGRAHRVPL